MTRGRVPPIVGLAIASAGIEVAGAVIYQRAVERTLSCCYPGVAFVAIAGGVVEIGAITIWNFRAIHKRQCAADPLFP